MAVDERRYSSFMTKTQHYRKVTKPLLERKRRARMNLYIDELKDLIVDTMEAQGEHVAKWEKADILEMTVNYLKMQKHKNFKIIHENQKSGGGGGPNGVKGADGGNVHLEKFRAGYTQAAYDVSKVFATLPGLDFKFTTGLMQHLSGRLKDIPQQVPTNTPQSGLDLCSNIPTQNTNSLQHHQSQFPQFVKPAALQVKQEEVWRPW